MIFKAIVVERTDDDNQIYITIPRLDGSTSKTNFKGVNKRLANICSLPGCNPVYATGDVVYVDFEQNDMANPIIIGSLLSSESKNSIVNLNAESLIVNVNTQLSDDIQIGEVDYSQISGSSSETDSFKILSVSEGGTGLNSVNTGYYLTGNNKAPLNEKTPEEVRIDIEACKTIEYSPITFTANGWQSGTGTSAGYFIQQVTVEGVLANYDTAPQYDCILSGTNQSTDENILEGFSYINILETQENAVIAKCVGDKPEVDVPIRLIVFI